MALGVEQLFSVFAARVAEMLRDRHGLDPASLLRVNEQERTLEGLVRSVHEGGPEWYEFTPTSEQLGWSGPESMATAFVAEYLRRRESCR
jgi:hypothetical protein